ncbi:MAG: Ig-like domain repeat protein [Acidobacteriota bacterium]
MLLWIAAAVLTAAPASAQAVQFFGPFTSYQQGEVVFAQGIVANAQGDLYVSGTTAMGYVPVDANGNPILAQQQGTSAYGSTVLGMAIDSANNIYRADPGEQDVQMYTYSGSTTNFVRSTIGTGWQYPTGIAVDSNLNVYVLDGGAGAIVKLSPNGSGGFNQSTLYTNTLLKGTTGLSIDSAGDFFIASGPDYGPVYQTVPGNPNVPAAVYKVTNTGSGYTLASIGSGWNSPSYTQVDSFGNVWVADYGAGEIVLLVPSGGSYIQSNYQSIPTLRALNINKAGKVYGFAYGNGEAQIWAGGSAPHNMGSYAVGTPAPTVTVTITFLNSATVGGFHVVTQGATGGDFSVASGGSCAAGSFTAQQTCTLNVGFTPKIAGLREGAITVTDTNGNVLGTNYIYGTGQAPLAALTPGTISTVVGTGTACTTGSCGDGGAAASASLNVPVAVVQDSVGDLYLADSSSYRVRKVDTAGNITTVAGNGKACSSPSGPCGDGGAATSASLQPVGLALDGAGTLYISDNQGNRIRAVNLTTGIITTVAGTGTPCASSTSACGDNGAAISAEFNAPNGIAVDGMGNLLVADSGDHRIRSVNLAAGTVSTVAGTGTACSSTTAACGDGGPATAANLTAPLGVAVDQSGNYYIADYRDNRVREISYLTGAISTVAGTGAACSSAGCGDGGAASSAQLNQPIGVAVDPAGDIYVTDAGDSAVRMVSISSGKIELVAGNYTQCSATTNACGDGGSATSANLDGPGGLLVDKSGNLLFTDSLDNRIRAVNVSSAGSVSFADTVAGSESSDSPAMVMLSNAGNAALTISAAASGTNPAFPGNFQNDAGKTTCAIVTTQAGSLAAGSTCLLGIDFVPGNPGPFNGSVVFTDNSGGAAGAMQSIPVAGTGMSAALVFTPTPTGAPGTPQTALISIPNGKSVASVMVVTQGIQNLDFTADPSTTCTSGATGSCSVVVDFNPKAPGLRLGAAIVTLNDGTTLTTYVFGIGQGPVLQFQPGAMSTVAGTGSPCYSSTGTGCGDGGSPLTASFSHANTVIYDAAGNAFVADLGASVVREITTAGVVSTVAGEENTQCGSTAAGSCGDGGAATSAQLNGPSDIAIDGAGNLYIADKGDNRVRVVNLITGTIQGFAGSGSICSTPSGVGSCGDGSAAINAKMGSIDGIAADAEGNVYIGDTDDHEVREVIYRTGDITTIAGTGMLCAQPTSACGDGGQATAAQVNYPNKIRLDSQGNIYIADASANRAREINISTGVISTVAGSGATCSTPGCGDGGQATQAQMSTVWGLALDGADNLYVVDNGDDTIRFVNHTTGIISTVVGNGQQCPSPTMACGDGGNGTQAELSSPVCVAFNPQGNIDVCDSNGLKVRQLSFGASNLSFASTDVGSTSTDSPQPIMIVNAGNAALTFPAPATETNPSFTLDGNKTTCSVVGTAGSAGSLAVGGSCTLGIDFSPTLPGPNNGSLRLTDNNFGLSGQIQTITLSGTGIQVIPTIAWPQPGAIVYGTNLSAALNAVAMIGSSSIAGTYTYTAAPAGGTAGAVTAASVLPVGTYTLNVSFTPTSNNYKPATGSVTLTVNKATPSVLLASSANPVLLENQITLTATVSSSASTPTGSVTFYNGVTAMGPAVPLTSGTATLMMSSLPLGTDSITAVYTGDRNFVGGASNVLPEKIEDFSLTISPASGSTTSQTVIPGNTATYNLVVSPVAPATTFPAVINLSVTGLPPGVSYTITPQSLASGSGSTPVTLTLTTTLGSAANHGGTQVAPFGERMAPIALGLLLLPFARRMRRTGRRLGRIFTLLLVLAAGAAALAGLSGCGAPAGFFAQGQKTYTVSVTGTSGPLSHSTSVSLTIQ